MRFEKLNVDTNKRGIWILYGLILGVVLIIIINYFISMAKYKVVDTTKLVSSNINYKLPDLTVLGIYVKNGEEYKYVEQLPEGNYTVNESMSYCLKKGSNEKIKNVFEYRADGLYIGINERGTRCKVYLDKEMTSKDTLVGLYKDSLSVTEDTTKCPAFDPDTGQVKSAINGISTVSGTLLCKGYDDDGETYYFRGKAERNWVKIDDTYWRIVRINGNGSIRLIFSGSGRAATTGTETMALTGIKFNSEYADNAYVGYMYGKPQTKSTGDDAAYKATHENSENSTILTQIATWYNENNISQTVKDKYIDEEAGFCGDRTPYASSYGGAIDKKNYGWSTNVTYYGSKVRVEYDKKPSFKCPQKEDLYTTKNSSKGNQALPVPVGLITADEVMFAGSGYGSDYNNYSYYLYTDSVRYWTMSPYYFDGTRSIVLCVVASGHLGWNAGVYDTYGVRPVINLKANTPFTSDGDGSSSNPFVVELN